MFGYSREAVRVKAKKCDGVLLPEYRKFSVDPQITSYEVLRSILAKAFDLRKDFSVSYRVIDDFGQETFLSLLSDWDLDAAFLSACDPCLCLQIDVAPYDENDEREDGEEEEEEEEWESPAPRATSLPSNPGPAMSNSLRLPLLQGAKLPSGMTSMKYGAFRQPSNLQGLLKSQVERTLGMVQRALLAKVEDATNAAPCDPEPPELDPVGDSQFRGYLDPLGTLVQSQDMRDAVFHTGVEPALRKVVWKHLLNVYPEGLTGRERMEYMRRKAQEYQDLKDIWRNVLQEGQVCHEVMAVSSMVRKDVLRTDRHLSFYAGSDDNQNVAALFNILTTYALNHPCISYCQGMSDLASPLLVTMQDEPSAYVCFCALMRRLQTNFSLDGQAMGLKFQHLSAGLLHYDPEFHRYLQNQQASDLLFCYRWLLLELKREFAFEDALRMLEVLWASLPPDWPTDELPLYQGPISFSPKIASPQGQGSSSHVLPHSAARHSAYTRLCAMRRRDARRLPTNKSLDERQLSQPNLNKEGRQFRRPFLSLDDSDYPNQGEPGPGGDKPATSPRVVRNLNEFRNFFSKQQVNGNRDSKSEETREDSEKTAKNLTRLGRVSNSHKQDSFFEEESSSACGEDVGGVDCNSHSSPDHDEKSNNSTIIHTESNTNFYTNHSSQKLKTESPKKTVIGRGTAIHDQSGGTGSPRKEQSSDDIFVWENPLQPSPPPSSPITMTNSCEEVVASDVLKPSTLAVPLNNSAKLSTAEISPKHQTNYTTFNEDTTKELNQTGSSKKSQELVQPWYSDLQEVWYSQPLTGAKLPPPAEFGGGNPFLIILCITLLRQHRDLIIQSHMDYNELAMHLDRMVRRHNVRRVLREARSLYRDYLAQYGNQPSGLLGNQSL